MSGQLSFEFGISLAEARAKLLDELPNGTSCPCCGQHAQIYRWSLYANAVRMLGLLWREGGTGSFVESKRVKRPGDGGSTSHLALWGLVEHEPDRRPDGGKSGWWRVTPLGERFLSRQEPIRKYAYVYNGSLLRHDGEFVYVTDIIADFDWREHMNGMAVLR